MILDIFDLMSQIGAAQQLFDVSNNMNFSSQKVKLIE